jgi:hypothetical protein
MAMKVFAFGLINLLDSADVGLVERGGGAGLALEAINGLRIAGEFRREKFEGYEAAKLGVLCLIDHAHPASPEFIDDAVMRDGAPDH